MKIYNGSFLDEGFNKHSKEVWGVEKFDIVMGNPPYNSDGTGTGNSIWHLFVEKSNILSNRYINFIHPSSWRMPLRESDRFYKSSKIIKDFVKYVKILKSDDINKYFGLNIKVDYYLLDKLNKDNTCLLENKDEKIKIDIKKLNFIPNFGFDLYKKLVNGNIKCDVIYSYMYDPRNNFITSKESIEYKYPLIHSTPKSGTRYMYSSRNDRGHFGIPKVIFGESGIYDVIIDMDGKYGMTQGAIGIGVSSLEEANNIKKVLLSVEFRDFLKSVLWSNFRIDWKLFSYLKKDFWKEFI